MSTGQNKMRNDRNGILSDYVNSLNFRPLYVKPKLKDGLNPVIVKAGAIALLKEEDIDKVFWKYGVIPGKLKDYERASEEYYKALYI